MGKNDKDFNEDSLDSIKPPWASDLPTSIEEAASRSEPNSGGRLMNRWRSRRSGAVRG